ncbi:hypothetical protein ACP8Y2_14170 [Herpetosiphon llansteffanensis]
MIISADAFCHAILFQDYATIRSAIDAGFDVNGLCSNGRTSFVQAAQPAKDMVVLRMLYEAGAVPDTPWLEELFNDFANGIERVKAPSPCLDAGTPDFTDEFTVTRFEYQAGIFYFSEASNDIEIEIKPFILDGECVQTSIRADGIALPPALDDLPDRIFHFPFNPDDGYIDASIYLCHGHNSVNISSISFKNLTPDKQQIDAVIEMIFVFDEIIPGYPTEALTLEISLAIQTID